MRESCRKLATFVPDLERQYGIADREQSWVIRVGEETSALGELGTEVSLTELVREVSKAVGQRLDTSV
ncbi:hypothetical protein [Streptomyces sp. AA1529]|uniref:hypothetical protein n=1 Tax=Streptomyces sp. AA1529 TaxID=1203257 RepID=UPI003D75BC90